MTYKVGDTVHWMESTKPRSGLVGRNWHGRYGYVFCHQTGTEKWCNEIRLASSKREAIEKAIAAAQRTIASAEKRLAKLRCMLAEHPSEQEIAP